MKYSLKWLAPTRRCIFDGDLNVSDEEVKSVEIPNGVVDIWGVCSSPKGHQYAVGYKNQ